MNRRGTVQTIATGSTGPEGLPLSSQSADRTRMKAAFMAAVEQMDPDTQVALALHLSGLETGADQTLEIHALVGEHGRGMILDWERRFGPSHARKGGLL